MMPWRRLYAAQAVVICGDKAQGVISHDGIGRQPPGQTYPTADRHGQAERGDRYLSRL